LEEGSISYSRSADSTYSRDGVTVGDISKWQIVQVSDGKKGKGRIKGMGRKGREERGGKMERGVERDEGSRGER
jgi:hypothetical protein